MIVPYQKYRAPSTHPLSNGYVERLPLLSVRLACNRKSQKMWALIDSGADMCTFGSEIAALLDIDLKTGRPLEMFGLVGGAELAWVHQVSLTVQGPPEEVLPSIDINVAFTESSRAVLALLGQKGFFDNFEVRFLRFKDRLEIYSKKA